MKKIFGLAKPVFTLGIVSLLTDLSSEMIYPILPLFLANTLGASTAFIGLVEGVAESTASILKVFSGYVSDKLGKRKQLILFGYGLSSFVKPFLAIVNSSWQVLGLRFADRLGKGIRGAPRDAMIADVTEPSERGRSFGFHRAMDTVGAMIGPGITFLLLLWFGTNYRGIFLMAAIPALAAVAVIIFAVKEIAPIISNQQAKCQGAECPKLSIRNIPPQFLILLGIVALFTLGNSSDAFLLLRAQNLGVSKTFVPLIWLFFNAVYTLVAIPAGVWSDKVGRRKVILVGLSIYALSYAGFALATNAWHAWVLFGIYGIYYGTTEGVIRAFIADVVPKEIRATTFGVYNFMVGVLLFPANLITGWLWKVAGAHVAFGFGAMLALTAALLFFIFTKRFKQEEIAQ